MIWNWTELSPAQKILTTDSIKDIFFKSSARQNFASEEERQKFWFNWTDYYFSKQPQNIWVKDFDGHLAGYLMGCDDSLAAEPIIRERIPSYSCFSDLFSVYPAHFHINVHPQFRGQSVGAELVETLIKSLLQNKTLGVHIVTSPDAANVRFYRRLGFNQEHSRVWNDKYPLLFMGRELFQDEVKQIPSLL